MKVKRFKPCYAIGLFLALLSPAIMKAQTADKKLKKLSLEELMNIEVTSVSKSAEKLTEVASAIQVITQQDILRSAATSIPEALKLASNLQVSQVSSHHWAISARGFNNSYANKLLVMIDGRTVYSPLFAGVLWDAQNIMLEDVERIEIISGPGGSLWGANAVNGVINIITKNATETKGIVASATVGTFLDDMLEARYGGGLGQKFSYRVYGQYRDLDNTYLRNGNKNNDEWRSSQGGFNATWTPANDNELTFQGNFYGGRDKTGDKPSSMDGQNLMGKWKYTISEKSEFVVQAYADRTWRHDFASIFTDELYTYDIELQHSFALKANQKILLGAGYRYMDDWTQMSTSIIGFVPKDRKMSLFSSFVQDEISFFKDALKLTIGSKLQHNNFSGFELQPSARAAWVPYKQHTIWGAVSRAVRAPSRIDVDYNYHVNPSMPSLAGGPDFVSEKVIAYELGYRVQPTQSISLSLATFYNSYDDLRSVEVSPGTQIYHIKNGIKGSARGLEFLGNFLVTDKWSLKGGYSYFWKVLKNKPSNQNPQSASASLGSDAEHIGLVQSILNLPAGFQFDVVARYISDLPVPQSSPAVSSYYGLDARIGFQPVKHFEISVSGQNLLKKKHIETGNTQIDRSFFGKVTWRY